MKKILDNASTNVTGATVQLIGRCTFFAEATTWGGATVTIKGRGVGATNFISMGELSAVTENKPLTSDVEGPWEATAVVSGAGGTTAGINLYANQ